MTWLYYQNYGTALQATALFHSIKKLGYDPYEISYTPRSLNKKFEWDFFIYSKKGKEVLQHQLNGNYQSKKKTALYENFLTQNLKFTGSCNTEPELQDLKTELDAFVCGSDQIWSPSCFDEKYFCLI